MELSLEILVNNTYYSIIMFFHNILCYFFILVYDIGGAIGDRNVVVLDDIRIDIMDYIMPAVCNDSEFRQMWTEFEWENKVKYCYILF